MENLLKKFVPLPESPMLPMPKFKSIHNGQSQCLKQYAAHTVRCLDQKEAKQKPGQVTANFGHTEYAECIHEAALDLEACSLQVMLYEQDFSEYSVNQVSKIGENEMQDAVDKVTAAKNAAHLAWTKETDADKKASLKKYLDTFTVHYDIVINEDKIDNTEDNIDKINAQLTKLRKEKGDKEEDKDDTDKEIPIIEHTIEELIAKIAEMKKHLLVLDVHTAKDEKERKEKLDKIKHLNDEIVVLGNRLPVLLKMLKEARENRKGLIQKRPNLDSTYQVQMIKPVNELQNLNIDDLFL